MASTQKNILENGTTIVATGVGTKQSTKDRSDKFIGFLKATNVNAATTLDVKIQHSPNGTDWFDLATFAQLVGVNGQEAIQITVSVFPNLRGDYTLVGATQSADILLELYSDNGKDD